MQQIIRTGVVGLGAMAFMLTMACATVNQSSKVPVKTPSSNKTSGPVKPSANRPVTAGTAKVAPVVQSPAPVELPPLSAELLEVAEQVYLGTMSCELGAQVTLVADPVSAGRFILDLGRQRFRLTPVTTTTGAVRLEDEHAGAVWLQLANKSMLMSQKLGKRLADDCTSPEQSEVARAMSRNPAPSILDPRGGAVVLAEPPLRSEVTTK